MRKDFRGFSIPGHSDLKTILGCINSGLVSHFYGMESAEFFCFPFVAIFNLVLCRGLFFQATEHVIRALKISLF